MLPLTHVFHSVSQFSSLEVHGHLVVSVSILTTPCPEQILPDWSALSATHARYNRYGSTRACLKGVLS